MMSFLDFNVTVRGPGDQRTEVSVVTDHSGPVAFCAVAKAALDRVKQDYLSAGNTTIVGEPFCVTQVSLMAARTNVVAIKDVESVTIVP
jgi:hypothetical protein